MDLTGNVKRKILIKKTVNPVTGEATIKVRPKPYLRRKIIVARGTGDIATIGDLITARLKPLRFAIVTGLNRFGVNTSGVSFPVLIALYYNHFSGKQIDVSEFSNHVAFKISVKDETAGSLTDPKNRTQFMQVNDIVTEIIELFRKSKEKYLSAEKFGNKPEQVLKSEDLIRAKAVFIVEKKLRRELRADHFVKQSDIIQILKIALIAFVAYHILKSL
jgi:hypothetical protein